MKQTKHAQQVNDFSPHSNKAKEKNIVSLPTATAAAIFDLLSCRFSSNTSQLGQPDVALIARMLD